MVESAAVGVVPRQLDPCLGPTFVGNDHDLVERPFALLVGDKPPGITIPFDHGGELDDKTLAHFVCDESDQPLDATDALSEWPARAITEAPCGRNLAIGPGLRSGTHTVEFSPRRCILPTRSDLRIWEQLASPAALVIGLRWRQF